MSPELREHIEAIAKRRAQLLDELVADPSGVAWVSAHSQLADDVVRAIYADLHRQHAASDTVALIATGGYGRSELSPFSDIDITVVPRDEDSAGLEPLMRDLFRSLHSAFSDMLGLNVGYAYRLISDAPGLDAKTRTGLIDMRLVAGNVELARRLEQALSETLASGEFILAKIREREAIFAKFHDSPLVVEPHLKEGAGGIRCFHCANWISEAVGERSQRATEDYDTILRYRNLLHVEAGKCQDLLSRQRQASLADSLGIDVFTMMAEVIEAGSKLHSFYNRSREKLLESRFALAPGILAVQGEVRASGTPNGGDMAVGISIATELGLRVSDIPMSAPSKIDGPAALYAISTGEATLRNLDRCGLLDRILPPLASCRYLIPSDTVHEYTVFEHTMRAIRFLDSIEPGTFIGQVRASVTDIEPLYLATLLHDVGKVFADSTHSESGAEIAAELCLQWGLAREVGEHVEWLVREHLSMAKFLRVRDIMNPHTIQEFAGLVKTTERLHLLTLLTWADTNAVADSAWTAAQETFLRELHSRTEALLTAGQADIVDPAQHRQQLLRRLRKNENTDELESFIQSLPAYYLTSTPLELIRLHLEFANKAIAGDPTVEVYARPDLDATELTICTLDQPRLLSRILGTLYAYDVSVSEIRASTTRTSPPVAVDVLTVRFGGRPVPKATMNQVTSTLLQILEGHDLEPILQARGKDPSRKQKVFSYTYIEGNPGILEIRAPRGRGMPFRFSRQIAENGWNVLSARVGQWAGNAAAAFYIQKKDGSSVSGSEVAELLRTSE